MHVDALAPQAALHEARDVGVLGREHLFERLEQHHLAAQAREARGDLHAGGAAPDDGQAGGQLGQRPCLLGADHAPAERHSRDRSGHRAGREDHGCGRIEVAVDANGGVRGEYCRGGYPSERRLH